MRHGSCPAELTVQHKQTSPTAICQHQTNEEEMRSVTQDSLQHGGGRHLAGRVRDEESHLGAERTPRRPVDEGCWVRAQPGRRDCATQLPPVRRQWNPTKICGCGGPRRARAGKTPGVHSQAEGCTGGLATF